MSALKIKINQSKMENLEEGNIEIGELQNLDDEENSQETQNDYPQKWPIINLDGAFSKKTYQFCDRSLRELEQFDVFFEQLA